MSGSQASRGQGHAGEVTTRLGVSIIAAGIALLVLRATGVIDNELADIASVIAIVLGALAIAIDGEAADRQDR
ncbi:MAG: hypothetical protein JWM89_25 [Acidimicrobiales bacterium]|nr:hypothetical protein [Acidimicrobiales bacterium]